ncbi:YbaB/EbfC family nucleoid-associated protein [Patescibacteria group bacterium]|nr:YbaB/EbfC family nucleoid-associated protein [Patescibacteria group bacterium]MBU1034388.1 YbaB/EbfC family nucleoid-associated protein [Patescibacteria group bacterium]MBU1629772.1 YbaB/EbfC family nucleoid-associated protein [Patescibacteria group bacterium]MBU1907934.1 YbaB/EbfC family nucleoid-associated protein [Patescibacteria group bacterium]
MFSKLKQFKNLRDKAKTIQSALAEEKAEGSAAWGKVKISFDGNQKILAVAIDNELMQDKTKLEGYIKEAANDGLDKIQKILAGKMKDLGGLDLAQEMQGLMKKE